MILLKPILLTLVLHFSVSNGRSPPINLRRICKKNIDLALVIDVSRSINEKDFDRQKQFVMDIIDFLDVGPDKTRVAAVTFSNYVFPQFFFNSYSTAQEIKDALGKIKYSTEGDATRTYKALEYTYEEIFKPGNGERGDVMDVVVVLTDGVTNPGSYDSFWMERGRQQTQIEAAQIRKRPAYIFAIGVGGQTNSTELNGISSDPDSTFTIEVPSFSDLNKDDIKKMLVDRSCDPDPNIDPDCTEKVADVFFLIDESASMSTEKNFKKEINFTISVVELLDVGPGKSQVGAITFGSEANVRLNLNEAKTRTDVATKLRQISWGAGQSTQLDDAFELLRTQGLNQDYGSRPDVPQIAVVITDGVSTDPEKTKEQLKLLHQEDYILFAIGVGPERDDNELLLIAQDSDHVFKVDNEDALSTIKESLATRLCYQGISASDLAREPEKPKQGRHLY